MKQYELMTIYKISLGEEAAKKVSADVATLVATLGGLVVESNFWGKRKFAYEIKPDKEGFYDVASIKISPEKIDDLKTKMSLMSSVVRYLVTAKDN